MAEKKLERSFGRFSIGSLEVHGELTPDGESPNLYLEHEADYLPNLKSDHIHGTLRGGQLITIAGVVAPSMSGKKWSKQRVLHYGNILFHDVIIGAHVTPSEKFIKSVTFQCDDGMAIFPDNTAFGFVQDAHTKIHKLLEGQEHGEIGPAPDILYFTGKSEIFECRLPFGDFRASHGTTIYSPNVRGLRAENEILLSIHFDNLVSLAELKSRLSSVSQLLGVLAGRPQNLYDINFGRGLSGVHDEFNLYQTGVRKHNRSERAGSRRALSPIDTMKNSQELSRFMKSWFEDEVDLGAARNRFFSGFAKETNFDIDRLIAAANLFDLIPNSQNPVERKLPLAVQAAVDESKIIFRGLPPSDERSAALDALGRLNGANLKKKVRAWSLELQSAFDGRFAELPYVTDQAIDCRNHYIHGSNPKFNYERSGMFLFLVRSLEFAFLASYLLKRGWDWEDWLDRCHTGSHPLRDFMMMFDMNLQELKSVIELNRVQIDATG